MTPSPHLWLIPAGMLLIAMARWPYAYYTLTRFVVFGCCCGLIYLCHVQRNLLWSGWFVGLLVVAAVFNPIIRVRLTRDIWPFVDLAGAVFLVAHMVYHRSMQARKERKVRAQLQFVRRTQDEVRRPRGLLPDGGPWVPSPHGLWQPLRPEDRVKLKGQIGFEAIDRIARGEDVRVVHAHDLRDGAIDAWGRLSDRFEKKL